MGWALTGRRFGTHQCWAVCIWATHQRRAVRAPWRGMATSSASSASERHRRGRRLLHSPPSTPAVPPFLSPLAALLLFAGWVRREAVKRVLFYSSPSSLLLGFYISDEKIGVNRLNPMLFSCSFCNSSRVLFSVQLWWQIWYESSTGYWLP